MTVHKTRKNTKKYKLEYAYHDPSNFCCSLDTKIEVIGHRSKNDIEMTLPCQRLKLTETALQKLSK